MKKLLQKYGEEHSPEVVLCMFLTQIVQQRFVGCDDVCRFWLEVQDLKRVPQQEVAHRVEEIWAEFLAEGAPSTINLDSHSFERTSQNLKDPGRYSYEDAQDHIYKLMKSDSYPRFLRSNVYQDLLMAKKKPETEQGRRTSLEKFTRSVGKSLTGKRLTGLMQSS